MQQVTHSVTIKRPRRDVYDFWRNLENLPLFMYHLERVANRGATSHWVVKAPGGTTVEWDAEIGMDQPNQLLMWRSLPGSQIPNEGAVKFTDAPGDRGTEIHVSLQYEPPAGALGAMVARMFGEEPKQQLRDDLRRLKQFMETGEVVFSEGSPRGAGEGATQERPAQPRAADGVEVRS